MSSPPERIDQISANIDEVGLEFLVLEVTVPIRLLLQHGLAPALRNWVDSLDDAAIGELTDTGDQAEE